MASASRSRSSPASSEPTAPLRYAIELDLDAAGADRVGTLCRRLEGALGIGTILSLAAAPHLSLALLAEIEEAGLAADLAAFATTQRPADIAIAAIGCFPGAGVLYLAPVVDAPLLAFHRSCHAVLKRHMGPCWEHYREGHWVPHVTLAMDLDAERLAGALRIVSEGWVPFAARLVALRLAAFPPVTTLARWPLAD